MGILTIFIFVVALYWTTINNGLIVDDNHQEKRIKEGLLGSNLKENFLRFYHRLYGYGTFYTKKYGHIHVLESAFRILLTAVICSLIYLVLGKNTVSFGAAMLYACHPINNQITCWFNGRRYAINIIIVLCMLGLGVWGIFLYPLTFAFQITAFLSPLLLAKNNPLVLLAIPIMLLFGWKEIKAKIELRFTTIPDQDRRKFTAKRLIVIVKYYGHYMSKMILPGRCSFIYKTLFYWGRTAEGNKDAYEFNWQFLRGILAIAVSLGGFLLFKGQMAYLWAFMCLSTLQWCAVIPIVGDLSDRYVSLPNVFMMFFVSYLVNTYCGVYALSVLVGLVIYYVMNLLTTMRMYKDYFQYWEYHRFHAPNVPVPLNSEIDFYIKTNDPQKALVLALDGLKRSPTDFYLLRLAAGCCNVFNDHKLALLFAKRAKENLYLYQEEHHGKFIDKFIDDLEKAINAVGALRSQSSNTAIQDFKSRQVRRAEERKLNKQKAGG